MLDEDIGAVKSVKLGKASLKGGRGGRVRCGEGERAEGDGSSKNPKSDGGIGGGKGR